MVAQKDIQFLKSPINKKEAVEIAQKFGGGNSGGGTPLGEWNAATNTPTLPSTPTAPTYKVGDYFTVSVDGTRFGFDWTENDRIVVIPDGEALQYNKEIGGAIDSITGNIVDDSDPANPVVDQVQPDWDAEEGLAEILNKPAIPAAQVQSDWAQDDEGAIDFIKNKPAEWNMKLLWVDRNRGDSYIADGTINRPYTTIQAAVDFIATQADKGTMPYNLALTGGTYVENVSLNNKGIFSLKIGAIGRSAINPVSGNAITADTDVSDLQDLKVWGVEFGKPVVLTGTNIANNFKTTEFSDCYFGAALTAQTLNNLALINCRSDSTVSLTNVNYMLTNSGYVSGNFSVIFSDAITAPANGLIGGYNNFGTVLNLPIFTTSGVVSLNVGIYGTKVGTTAGAATIPANCSVIAYASILRGNWTNNGTLALRNSMTENAVAGTAPVVSVLEGNIARMIAALTAKTTLVGGDSLPVLDSEASNVLKKTTITNLETYFNGKYLSQALVSAKILVGNGSNAAAPVDLSGEATLANTGAITLDNAAIIAKVLTGFTSAPGVIAATDSILEAIEKLSGNVDALESSVILKGSWDASAGTFPGVGVAQAGWSYIVSVAGTVDGIAFAVNDRAIAIADNASTTTYAGNWFKADYTDQVLSVNTQTGAVVLNQDDIGDGTTYKQFSATEQTKLSGIEANADVTDATNVASAIVGTSAKTTPVDADLFPLIDSEASNVLKKLSWANIKATLKTYFDTLYQPIITFGTGVLTALGVNVGSVGAFVVNGGALGTPSSGNLSNCSGITIDNMTYPIMQLEAASFSISNYEGLEGGAPATVDGEFLSFPNAGTTYAWKKIYLPEGYSGDSIKFRFAFHTAGSGDAKLFARLKAVPDNTDISGVSFGTAVGLVKTAGTANNLNISSFSGDVTIANTPASGKMAFLQIYRDAADAGDTLNDALILEDLIIQLT